MNMFFPIHFVFVIHLDCAQTSGPLLTTHIFSIGGTHIVKFRVQDNHNAYSEWIQTKVELVGKATNPNPYNGEIDVAIS